MNFFSLVSTLIVLAAVSSYINYRYIRLPTTIGVMLVALVGSLALILASSYTSGLLRRRQFDADRQVSMSRSTPMPDSPLVFE
jgi:CPA1 family monovalent cation:H+ antiporter